MSCILWPQSQSGVPQRITNGFITSSSLSLAALITTWQHARMPLFVFSVSIAEPSSTLRAMQRRRIIARLVVGRHSLAQAPHVLALHFFFSHRHLVMPFYGASKVFNSNQNSPLNS